jgi:hypothetical protein
MLYYQDETNEDTHSKYMDRYPYESHCSPYESRQVNYSDHYNKTLSTERDNTNRLALLFICNYSPTASNQLKLHQSKGVN